MACRPYGAILLYHRVAVDRIDPYGLCTSPDEFRQQMRLVRERCTVSTLDELISGLHAGLLPDRSIAITFDDGYLDNLTTASAILVELGLPATFFATTANLSEPQPYWWDVLARTPGGASQALHEELIQATVERRRQLLLGLENPASTMQTLPRPMSGIELRALSSRPGHRIGVHTTNHLFLPSQPAEICESEMRDSKNALEGWLDVPIDSIAYPFGGVTSDVTRVARSLGFTKGVAVERCGVQRDSDAMRLPRVQISSGMNLATVLDEIFAGATEE